MLLKEAHFGILAAPLGSFFRFRHTLVVVYIPLGPHCACCCTCCTCRSPHPPTTLPHLLNHPAPAAPAAPCCALLCLLQYMADPEPIVAHSCEVALDMLEFERSGAFQYADDGN